MTRVTVLAERTVAVGPFSSLRFAAVTDDRGDVRVVVHRLSTTRAEFLCVIRPNRLRAVPRALTALAAEILERP